MPSVLNARKLKTTMKEGAVYVGRPSPWGNPFVTGKDGTRDEVIAKFEAYLMSSPELLRKCREELHGKDLICWCHPKRCHADILLREANAIDIFF